MKTLAAFFLLLIAAASPAHAQTITRCAGYDTLVYGTTPMVALVGSDAAPVGDQGGCDVTTGPKGTIFAVATTQSNCNIVETETVQMFVGAGSSPTGGSNFSASMTGGNMTVTFMIDGFGRGSLATLGPISSPGTGGPVGPITYPNVAFTGGTGAGAKASAITVQGGGVTSVSLAPSQNKIGYTVGDILSVNPASIGGTTGFGVPVATVRNFDPWVITPGQIVTGSGINPPTTILSQTSAANGGPLGQLGVYVVDNPAITASDINWFGLNTVPGGVTYISPPYNYTVCRNGFFLGTVTGTFTGSPNSPYYVGIAINGSDPTHVVSWDNQGILVITY